MASLWLFQSRQGEKCHPTVEQVWSLVRKLRNCLGQNKTSLLLPCRQQCDLWERDCRKARQ